jgi:hypothetical protein
MTPVKVGDRVRVVDREPTPADVKSGLYYGYFRDLVGVIERVYDDNTVCVDVDIETLPEDVLLRHKDIQTAARDKWIAGLSQEQRNRLSEQDKQFKMSYKVVVAAADVEPGPKASAKSGNKTRASNTAVKAEKSNEAAAETPQGQSSADDAGTPTRLTEKELAAKEREFLKTLKTRQTGDQEAPES